MEHNKKMEIAWDFIEHTGKSIFLTGKAGTGKTTFLKTVQEHSRKRMVVVAPTGVAAINAGGVTIHSFFQLPLSPYVPGSAIKDRYDFSKEKRKLVRSLDMLVIDEISMVRSDLLDAIDFILRRYRDHSKPFGGIQLLMIGDLQQLTPVVTPEDERILNDYYDTPYFFGSKALQQISYVTLQLDHVYRQQDTSFLSMLNNIRTGQCSEEDLRLLNARCVPDFQPKAEDGYIRLTTHNVRADRFNQGQLDKLSGKTYNYNAEIKGDFPTYNFPTEESLTLKVGAQVMFIKNDASGNQAYYNGRIGRVTFLDRNHIFVLCPGEEKAIEVEPQTWENTRYELNPKTREIESQVQGTFKQFPLRLAWSITIHKSQGLTFDHAIIDAASSFAPGQVYVALSRCRTLEGLVLAVPISRSAIINDQRVDNYITHQEEAARQSIEQLPSLIKDYERFQLIDLFTFNDIGQAEEMMSRLFIDHFSHAYPQLTALHKQAAYDMTQKVVQVAYKWTTLIGATSHEGMHEKAFVERVQKSIMYFHTTLEDILTLVINTTKNVQTGNKTAAKRLENLFLELEQAFLTKQYTLEAMMQVDFTPATYLAAKQKACMRVLDLTEPSTAHKSRKKTVRQAAPKEPKIKTWVKTYNLFCEGKGIEEIAKERELTTTTVRSHLERYVLTGEVPLDKLIAPERQRVIKLAIAKAGSTSGLSAIKAFCPDDITFEDIRTMVNMIKGKR